MKLYEFEAIFHTPEGKLEVYLFSESSQKAYWAFLGIENEHNRKPSLFEFYQRPKRTGKIMYEFPFEKTWRNFRAWRLKIARKKQGFKGITFIPIFV